MKELGSILESHDWLRRKLTFWGSAVSDYLLLCNNSPSWKFYCANQGK